MGRILSCSTGILSLCATSLGAQATSASSDAPPIRVLPSGHAIAEVRLTTQRPQGMAGMTMNAPAPATPAAAAQPAAPAAQPQQYTITIDYGQPHLRGRMLHTDSLVPYDRPWRLGANASTTLSTDVDLQLGGAMIPKGKYVLYAIPSRAGWTLVVQKSAGQSAMQFDAAHDVARVALRTTRLASPMESLTMWLIPSREPGMPRGELRIAWGTEQHSADWMVPKAP